MIIETELELLKQALLLKLTVLWNSPGGWRKVTSIYDQYESPKEEYYEPGPVAILSKEHNKLNTLEFVALHAADFDDFVVVVEVLGSF